MSLLINAISALGNNSGIYPLIARDCGIEVPTKVVQTYNQNKKDSAIMAKHATRERALDEYSTTAVWVGGVPAVEYGFNKFIAKQGLNGKISYKLFENNEKKGDKIQQSLDINIEKFKNTAPKEVAELEKIKANKGLFKKFTTAKYVAALVIPIAFMGVIIPKVNFLLTSYLMDKDAKKGLLPEKYLKNKTGGKLNIVSTDADTRTKYDNLYKSGKNTQFTSLNSIKQKNNPSFTGFSSFMTGLTHQQKMAATDGGYAIGRVATSRKRNEAVENGFKMAGMMYLNFIAPKKIEKGLDYMTQKLFGINPALDPKIMANKRFLALVRSNKLELPDKQENVLEFLDEKPKSLFSKIAAECGEVKYLESGVRDPGTFVDTEKVFKLSQKMNKFASDARLSGNVKSYAQKALRAKTANIAANIAISSTLLAVALPQAQFALRRTLFGSEVDPGLIQ
ncbi:MAG: hypothetical protein LUB59_03975 [Candidatus Gastranaerophilales bacterium]|nr:hypothetical protein [Candidatus Gastranaerophilales bacterium]